MTSIARREEQDETGDYSDASQEVDHNNSGNDVVQNESDYDSNGSDSEHSEGDPENQETEKRVDDDEDRSNPQYIPKRGTFYEHDDRTAASGEESSNTTSEVSEKKEGSESGAGERKRPPRKSEVVNKWSHDKYNENEQVPKSRDELVSIYGYDIRNEDAPPHARRNRRYGRGPNKYTRTWEDEEAYRRQAGVAAPPAPRRAPRPEEFPPLDPAHTQSKRRHQRPRSKSQPNSVESLENGTNLRRNASVKTKGRAPPRTPNNRSVASRINVTKNKENKEKLPAIENLTITTTVVGNSQNSQAQRKVNASVAQQKPVATEQAKKKPAPQPQPQSQNNAVPNKSPPQPQSQPKQPPTQPVAQQQQNNAVAENRSGGKRYSSLRQRSLADTYPAQCCPSQPPPQPQPQPQPQAMQHKPPQATPQIAYHAEYNSGNQPSPHQGSPAPQPHPQQQMIHQVNQQVHRSSAGKPQPHGPSPPHQQLPQQTQQQVRLGMLEQQQMVQHHTMHNIPQQHAMGQMQQPQGYAPPAIMPAQYMQQAPGFAGAPMFAQPPGPYPQHLYQHHNYATQAGGVTYYSCAEQEQAPRPQRRPTAAIPIVRPTPPQRQANSSEKDNIDRIVENMFVRKPWPATSDAKDKDKLQAETRNSQEPSKEAPSIPTEAKPVESKEEPAPVEKEIVPVTPVVENVDIVDIPQEVVDSTQNA